jgi:hypothetical protein
MSTTGPFNTDNHFGTIRMNQSNQGKLQEALNLQHPTIQHKPSMAQRPTNKPPPPPVPNRLPGTNLTNNHAKSTTALNLSSSANDNGLGVPRRMPNSGSSNNISSMDQSDSAPPLPPHRISSQSQMRAQQAAPIINTMPPEVPRRHSSMRNSIEVSANNGKYNPNVNNTVMNLVVDLEERYQLMFHKVSEFPMPKPFLNLDKNYPSKTSIRQQQNGI